MAFFDVLLHPHNDLHMALTGTPPLTLEVILRTDLNAPPGRLRLLNQLNPAAFSFHFFAPHRPVGQRLTNLPTVGPNFVVQATQPGVYLFLVAFAGQPGPPAVTPFNHVARLQVHTEMIDWWFGNTSVTVAQDPELAHARPTIYGRFKEDSSGTDVVGDITGHDFVTLTSADPTRVVVAPRGRLRGATPTAAAPVTVTGTFAGQSTLPAMTTPKPLPVRVVDYSAPRLLTSVRPTDLVHPEQKANLVFLSEGFVEADKDLFDRTVQRAVDELFDKPRHEPFGLLENAFNVFSRFEPSQQQQATCGYQVMDEAANTVPKGHVIPLEKRRSKTESPTLYTLSELVRLVGLPKRNEDRTEAQLRALWRTLPDFVEARVDAELVGAWRTHRSESFLQASDTFFGMYLGARWADNGDVPIGAVAVPPPAQDNPQTDPNLTGFIRRLQDFYRHRASVSMTLDPRRNAPEVYGDETILNTGTPLMSYLANLRTGPPQNTLVGPNWLPSPTIPSRSRGLVVLVTHEPTLAGRSINDASLVALSVNYDDIVEAAFDPGTLVKRRLPIAQLRTFKQPDGIVSANRFIDTAAHELGHSFNLGDEYEKANGADPLEPTIPAGQDLIADNLTRIGFIHAAGGPADAIDVDRVKWSVLPRMRAAARLTAPSTRVSNGIQVSIGTRDISTWKRRQAENAEVRLRNFNVQGDNRQLPFLTGADQHLTNLRVVAVNEAAGTLVLGGPGLPPPTPPIQFAAGSVVYVPHKDGSGNALTVIEPPVLALLRDVANQGNRPLNKDPDNQVRHDGPDEPKDIPGFKAPCRPARLLGVFEGGRLFSAGYYRPAGTCKMRDQFLAEEHGQFCFACKWLIVNLVDPSMHGVLQDKFYPKAKKND